MYFHLSWRIHHIFSRYIFESCLSYKKLERWLYSYLGPCDIFYLYHAFQRGNEIL
jgi:hypothetical protein